MQSRAEIVIVGGGIAGASIAYHLAQLGKRDVAVLEQGTLVSGTTSHAPGLVGQLRSSPSLIKMLLYSVSLFKRLSVDGVPGFHKEGSLRLACSKPRLAQIQQHAELAGRIGLEVHFITLREARELFPFFDPKGVEGVLFVPDDGSAVAGILAQALILGARAEGVAFYPQTRVQKIDLKGGRVHALETSAGRIETETLVVACGIWSPLIGRMVGVSVPLSPMQHQYAVTEPLAELAGRTVPNLRDPDHLIYLRQRDQSFAIGGYERQSKPFDVDAIPERPDPTVQAFVPEQFQMLHKNIAKRIPILANVPLDRCVNGLESFTPDGEFLLGPAPEVPNFWSACGFCAHGISSAGGVGKVMAEWIVHGDPGLDLSNMSLTRFAGQSWSKQAIQEAASKVYGTYYDILSH
jgi:glycine/D-amino acid oxidase-like deaminating enzyme